MLLRRPTMACVWLVMSILRVLIAVAMLLWYVTLLLHALFADFVIDLLIERNVQLVFLDRRRVGLAIVWNLISCSLCVSYAVVVLRTSFAHEVPFVVAMASFDGPKLDAGCAFSNLLTTAYRFLAAWFALCGSLLGLASLYVAALSRGSYWTWCSCMVLSLWLSRGR